MSLKKSAVAPSNLAFIKYWGRKDESLALPANASLSVTLSGMTTTTTVEVDATLSEDSISINDTVLGGDVKQRAVAHLERIRRLAGKSEFSRVVSTNSFPMGTGLSSSASGFAALTLAASNAYGLNLSEKELSILARQSSSGSACRSIPSGFCEWLDGDSSDTSYAEMLYPARYWDIRFVVAVVSEKPKHVSSTDGQMLAHTSPFFAARRAHMTHKIDEAKKFLAAKDFTALGKLTEQEALELHAIMITQAPPLIYWSAGTVVLMQLCQKWREEGTVEAYFSINTGQDIYFMVRPEEEQKLVTLLEETGIVRDIIKNQPGEGARLINEHLF